MPSMKRGAIECRSAPTMEVPLPLKLHDPESKEAARIQAAVDGDPAARDWLVERFSPTVLRFSRHMMNNEQDARDVTQDTMVKILKNLHRYDNRWRFSTWIISIARNTCIDEFRRRRRRSYDEPPEVVDTSPRPDEITAQQRRATRLHRALALVPPLYREILVLYHFEHRKYREIAEILDIPIGTVMNRIFRARRKLRLAYETIDAAANDAAANDAEHTAPDA